MITGVNMLYFLMVFCMESFAWLIAWKDVE